MTALSLLWLAALLVGVQPAPDLALDVRVFRGSTEVTAGTNVTVFKAGNRTSGKPIPEVAGGRRRIPLPAGQYDLQLVQQQDGKVIGIAWTSLRLLVDYPGEYQRHLEVLNFEKGWGALQIRQAGQPESSKVDWSTRLLRADGSEAARGVTGDGYQVLVAPTGTYLVEVTRPDGSKTRMANVEVRENLTYVRTF
jgi:hypothetical protein